MDSPIDKPTASNHPIQICDVCFKPITDKDCKWHPKRKRHPGRCAAIHAHRVGEKRNQRVSKFLKKRTTETRDVTDPKFLSKSYYFRRKTVYN